MNRRTFIRVVSAAGLAGGTGLLAQADGYPAQFFRKRKDGTVQCTLCPWECVISDGRRGACSVRENRSGSLYTLAWANPCSLNSDPIEKKPFYHFLPGTDAFSLATGGCNLTCKFCQNWQIARARPDGLRTYTMGPSEVAAAAGKAGARSVAFTYSEPVVFYEFMLETARRARETSLHPVVVSNGFVNAEPLARLMPFISAYKVDLKAFTESYYKAVCGGRLQPVLDTLVRLKKAGVWVEIVYLVLPTLNDSEKEIAAMSGWILEHLGPDVPLHFSRFHPTHLMKHLPPTPVKTLETLHRTASSAGINYVYIGNVPGHAADNTFCPGCGSLLIERKGFTSHIRGMAAGKCTQCGREIPGVWG